MTVKVYGEGGGDRNKALSTRCRQGFSEFLRKAGLTGHMPRVVACGGRGEAYKSFRTAHEHAGQDEISLLLVDSEAPVSALNPWDHVRLRQGDGWECPPGASGDHLHFMVQAMEAWFHADKAALQAFYGKDFRVMALSQRPDIENIPKTGLFEGLKQATKDCQKGEYSKGEHSFQLLARLDPARVRAASSAHAGRFLSVLDRVCIP